MEKAGNTSERCHQNRVIRKLNALLLWAENKIKELKTHFLLLRKEVDKATHEREGNRQSIYRNAEPAAGPSGSFERGAADPRTGYEYAYESVSYRDPVTKKPKSKRTYLGRVDPVTREILPKCHNGK